MLQQFKSLFARKRLPESAAQQPVGETILFNAYCTRLEIPQPTFSHTLHERFDLSSPSLLADLNDFCGYVLSRGDGQMSRDKYHVILHLQRVQHHVSLSVGVNDMPAFHAWAAQANALLIGPDGSVTDPQGRVLVDVTDGKGESLARVPYPERALTRKAATEAALAARGVTAPDSLPPLICEDELALRTRDEVVERARALLLVVLRADSVASGEAIPLDALLSKMPLGDDALSPLEQAFLQQEAPSKEDCAPFIWRYESLYLLEWALGLVDELPYPDAPADPSKVVDTLIEMRGPALRPAAEILDALDLHYRLHWAVRQSRLKQGVEAGGIDADVVNERHRALNWLVRFQHAGWDVVDTPT